MQQSIKQTTSPAVGKASSPKLDVAQAEKMLAATRAFIGEIQADRVVLDGQFRANELEAVLFLMRNRRNSDL
jgi:hypothetical protein